jgi:tRNA (cytidine32/uridine32-2'-O)-methyltransferase
MSIRIVLARTSHPGNVGSAARAMKTMGLESLWLVAPERFPATEATVMAAGADDVLQHARVVADVRTAVADCGLVVGTTARGRHLPWRIVEPREAALEIAAAAQASEVAVLFGNERAGLENEELEQCHTLLTIPTGPRYTSLNLAMAVQVVAYELCLALRDRAGAGPIRNDGPVPLASAVEMDKFYAHLEQVLDEIDFRDRTNSGHLMARLRRLFQRAVLDQNEMNILRGILTAVQGKRRRAGEPHARPQGTSP